MRRPATLLVVVLLGGLLPFGSVRAADPSSDIPGVPLPGAVATGQLGGPVYDVVYRLQVPVGHVIVAGLTGSAGTDFDLYLFDSNATTVVTNGGVVARSTGPDSTESLSYPSRLGGTYYLDLNGASNVEGTYTLTVQVLADPSPPTVSRILLAEGRTVTADPSVDALIVASDDLSGVTSVALSADGVTFEPWIPYTGHAAWTFPPGDGVKRLWVRAMNGVGLVSSPTVASITLDTAGPTVLAVTPGRDAVTTDLRPRIGVTFSEPIDPASWMTYGLVVQSAAGAIVLGSSAYDPASLTGTFVPVTDLVPGLLYVVTVGSARDLAGNVVVPTGSWWLKPMIGTSATIRASSAVVTYGGAVTLSGAVAVPVGDAASVEERPVLASDFAAVASVAGGGSSFSVVRVPTMTTRYRVDYPGSVTALPARSSEVLVAVRWAVVFSGPGPATVRTGRVGVPIAVQARVRPVVPGATVSFRLYRYDPNRRRYVYAGSRGTRVSAAGTATISWTPAAGRWRWNALAYGTGALSAATTSTYTWSISR